MPRLLVPGIVAALLAGSATAHAQSPAGRRSLPPPSILAPSLEVSPFAGYFWFTSRDQNFSPSFYVGGRLGINFNKRLAFEASVGYVPTWTLESIAGQPAGLGATVLNPHFDFIVHFTEWAIVPYLAIGAGFFYYNIGTTQRREDIGVTLERPAYANPDFDFLFDAGLGIKFFFIDRVGIRIDGRYNLVIGGGGSADGVAVADSTDPADVRYEDEFHMVELTGSLFFLLGGDNSARLDPDGDGLMRGDDQCPDIPEDFDQFQDSDGCPEPDNDGDGVVDSADACRDRPEDPDGFRDDDGCPDEDNDGDGIMDGRDECPNRAEDDDGFEDNDGCPDDDNDNDRIPDVTDDCPMEPEDRDSWEDADGCPEWDNDGDGIPDDRDECPNSPEDMNGYQDQDGCPEYDRDQDGISDDADGCPEDPEDRDGFEDLDGCPEYDNDADGIPDTSDTCPMEPEDRDGYDDTDGCPDIDNDGDGILDVDDVCPMEPETRNGFDDLDGCPDEVPDPLAELVGRPLADIQFQINRDELLPSSYPTLNAAADVLSDYPDVRLEIQGHASSDGDDLYNLELSQRRAESVRRYLMSRGIGESRLFAAGYGETRPIASNDSESGRAMNRRVEFHIILPDGSRLEQD